MVTNDDILRRQILDCKLRLMSQREISEELKINRAVVSRIMNQKEFHELFVSEAEEATRISRNMLKKQVTELVPEMVKTIKAALKEGKIEAVKVCMEVLGMKQQEVQQQDTTIQVVLPNLIEEKIIDVTEVKDAADV